MKLLMGGGANSYSSLGASLLPELLKLLKLLLYWLYDFPNYFLVYFMSLG